MFQSAVAHELISNTRLESESSAMTRAFQSAVAHELISNIELISFSRMGENEVSKRCRA